MFQDEYFLLQLNQPDQTRKGHLAASPVQAFLYLAIQWQTVVA